MIRDQLPTAVEENALLHARLCELAGDDRLTKAEALEVIAQRLADQDTVVKAAQAWRAMRAGTPTKPKPESATLIAALDRIADRRAA